MRSAKKSTKILSALSMAAAGVFTSHAAHGATLSMYYGEETVVNHSNNGVFVASNFNPASTTTDTVGQYKYLIGASAQVTSLVGPTTINVPVGDYLSLAIDAVLTGNLSSDAGDSAGGNLTGSNVSPSYLGLSSLAIGISSTDQNATFLTPIGFSNAKLSSYTNPAGANVSANTYNAFGYVNGLQNTGSTSTLPYGKAGTLGANGGTSLGPVPQWDSIATPADVQPNVTGYDPGTGNGNVGLNGFMNGGNKQQGTTNEIVQFASQTNLNTYATATEFGDGIIFKGLAAGTVTLQPYVQKSASGYWSVKTAAHTTIAHGFTTTGAGTKPTTHVAGVPASYQVNTLGSADVVNNLPLLVINVGTTVTTTAASHHAIVSLTAAADTVNYGTTITNGTGDHQGTFTPASANTLTVTGGGGQYNIAQVTGINSNNGDATGNVNVSGWNPASNKEIYGVDVKVGGSQASPAQIAALITEIGGEGLIPASGGGVTASATDPDSPAVLAALDTGTTSYNLFLTYAAGGPGASDNLGLDLSAANDPTLVNYTFSAVAVVPEPMSLGLLALGGVGLM